MENKSFIDKANTVADFNVSLNICGQECDKVTMCVGLAYKLKSFPKSRSSFGTFGPGQEWKPCKTFWKIGASSRKQKIYFQHHIHCAKGGDTLSN